MTTHLCHPAKQICWEVPIFSGARTLLFFFYSLFHMRHSLIVVPQLLMILIIWPSSSLLLLVCPVRVDWAHYFLKVTNRLSVDFRSGCEDLLHPRTCPTPVSLICPQGTFLFWLRWERSIVIFFPPNSFFSEHFFGGTICRQWIEAIFFFYLFMYDCVLRIDSDWDAETPIEKWLKASKNIALLSQKATGNSERIKLKWIFI